MYESFYGLKEKPFTLLPDPDYLYLSPKHQRALTLLEYGMMNQAGFSVICGDTGAGKTTLIRRLLSDLGDDTKVGLITNTHHSFGELLNWVLMAFGLDGEDKNKSQMHLMFVEFLIEQYADNKHTVLIVDEAQNMDADTLEELRMLSNINADKDQVLQVILAGQPALRETLRKPELMQFAQRIAVDYYLESLSQEETAAYIHHRLSVAGSQKEIFTEKACIAIYKYSGGTPRLINLLCDTSLVYSYAEQNEVINEQLVHDVVREQHSNSIIPTFNTGQVVENSSRAADVVIEKPAVEKVLEKKSSEVQSNKVQSNLAQSTIQAATQVAAQQASNGANNTATEVDHTITAQTTVVSSPQSEQPKVAPANSQSEKNQDKEDSNVTPIKTSPPEISKPQTSDKPKKKAKSTNAQSTVKPNTVEQKATEDDSPDALQDTIRSNIDDIQIEAPVPAPASPAAEASHLSDEAYPIVHIEENPKKGLSIILLALVSGMFIASIAMMVMAWMLFGDSDKKQQNVQQNIIQQSQQDAENRELQALKKERDAALAVTHALERERDAALQAAKAQEEIRAAELRASEILATQERKAEKRLRQARARAREAEIAESKARAREREIKLKTERREAELERQRIELLKEERRRRAALAAEEKHLRQQQAARLKEQQKSQPNVRTTENIRVEKAQQPKPTKKAETFSSNPCNSPSAKFLSTCKK